MRHGFVYAALTAVLALSVLASVAVGAVYVDPLTVIKTLTGRAPDETLTVIISLRCTRAVLTLCVGASLAVSGTVFQGLFRNPLADPYVIGTSAGAAFGAVCAIVFGAEATLFGFSHIGSAAFAGGLAATAIVYAIGGAGRLKKDAASLLLAGTALGSFFSALVSIVLALKDKNLHQAWFWLLGGFSGRGLPELMITAPALLTGLAAAFASSRVLDILSAGDEEALSLGLKPARARLIAGSFSALAVSASVALAGAIGFVGLVAPHLARRFVGPRHIRLIPAAALTGAALLVLADTAGRVAFAPLEMPVGAMTALIGAPFFLYKIATRGLSRMNGNAQ